MTPTKTSRFLARALLGSVLAGLTGGCADVGVVEHRLSESGTASSGVVSGEDAPRDVYSVHDERVTLSARLDAAPPAKPFMVEWFLPDGGLYIRRPVRARRGGEEGAAIVAAAMAIRGEPPSRRPGTWKVRLSLAGEVLVERRFEIRRDGPVAARGTGAAPAPCPGRVGPVPRSAWRGTGLLRRAGATYDRNVLLSSPQAACPPIGFHGRSGPEG